MWEPFWMVRGRLIIVSLALWEFSLSHAINNRMRFHQSGRPQIVGAMRSASWESESKYHPGPPTLISRLPKTFNQIPLSSSAIQLAVLPSSSIVAIRSPVNSVKKSTKRHCDSSKEICVAAAPARFPDASPGANVRYGTYAQGFSFAGRSPSLSMFVRRPLRFATVTTSLPATRSVIPQAATVRPLSFSLAGHVIRTIDNAGTGAANAWQESNALKFIEKLRILFGW